VRPPAAQCLLRKTQAPRGCRDGRLSRKEGRRHFTGRDDEEVKDSHNSNKRAPPNAELFYFNTNRTNVIPPTLACGVHPRRHMRQGLRTSASACILGPFGLRRNNGTVALMRLTRRTDGIDFSITAFTVTESVALSPDPRSADHGGVPCLSG
jgi:hypothetical protein